MRHLLFWAMVVMGLALTAPASAGDRGLYLSVVELPDAATPEATGAARATSDAFMTQLLRCEATPLPACRTAHAQGQGDRYDTGLQVILYTLPATATPELMASAARNQRRATRALAPMLTPMGIDGVLILQEERGRLFITALFSDGTRAARVPVVLRENADHTAVWQRAIQRALRPIVRRWVP